MTTVNEYAKINNTFDLEVINALRRIGVEANSATVLTDEQIAHLHETYVLPNKWEKRHPRPTKKAVYSSRTADKFVVRLPDGMRERIEKLSKTKLRSMNSQIIYWLEMCIPLEEKNENGFSEEDLQAFMEIDTQQCVIVPHQKPAYAPAPGVPTRVKGDENLWIVKSYAISDAGEAVAWVQRPNLEKPLHSDFISLSDLEPV